MRDSATCLTSWCNRITKNNSGYCWQHEEEQPASSALTVHPKAPRLARGTSQDMTDYQRYGKGSQGGEWHISDECSALRHFHVKLNDGSNRQETFEVSYNEPSIITVRFDDGGLYELHSEPGNIGSSDQWYATASSYYGYEETPNRRISISCKKDGVSAEDPTLQLLINSMQSDPRGSDVLKYWINDSNGVWFRE